MRWEPPSFASRYLQGARKEAKGAIGLDPGQFQESTQGRIPDEETSSCATDRCGWNPLDSLSKVVSADSVIEVEPIRPQLGGTEATAAKKG